MDAECTKLTVKVTGTRVVPGCLAEGKDEGMPAHVIEPEANVTPKATDSIGTRYIP